MDTVFRRRDRRRHALSVAMGFGEWEQFSDGEPPSPHPICGVAYHLELGTFLDDGPRSSMSARSSRVRFSRLGFLGLGLLQSSRSSRAYVL